MRIICTTIAVSLLLFPLHKRLLAQHSLGACSPSGDTCSFFTINLTSTIDSCNTCEGTASVNIIGGTGPFTYFWFPTGQTPSLATGLCAGTYTIQVSDSSGNVCFCSTTITSPPPLTATCSANPDTVVSGNYTQLLVVPSGGIPPYSYYWIPPNDLDTPTISNPIGFLLMSICYVVTVTDSFGCTDTCQTCVFVNTNPGINDAFEQIQCKIFPNPVSQYAFIIKTEENKNFIVRITNSLGQKVAEKYFQKKIEVDVSKYQKGLYLVEVCTAEGKLCHTEKVIIE